MGKQFLPWVYSLKFNLFNVMKIDLIYTLGITLAAVCTKCAQEPGLP